MNIFRKSVEKIQIQIQIRIRIQIKIRIRIQIQIQIQIRIQIQISLKSYRSNGYFTWGPIYIYDHISHSSS
jgi:hypothetical protein